jgi:N-acetylneuraminic acid mutarotase
MTVEDRWLPAPPLNTARGGLIDALLKVPYAIGGFTTGFGKDIAEVERLDRPGGRWTRVAPMPTARGNAAATAAREEIHVFGGYLGDKPSDVVEVLGDGWRRGRPLPAARGGAAAVTVDDRILVVGGFDENDLATDVVLEYQLTAGRWGTVRPMPTRRGLLKVAVLDGFVYAIGGRDDNAVSQTAVERYDPATDTWEPVAPLRTARGNPGVAVANGGIYAVGGQGAGVALRTTERYDPGSGRWTLLEPLLAVPRSSLSAAHLTGEDRNVLVAFGGFEPFGGTPVASARVEVLGLDR